MLPFSSSLNWRTWGRELGQAPALPHYPEVEASGQHPSLGAPDIAATLPDEEPPGVRPARGCLGTTSQPPAQARASHQFQLLPLHVFPPSHPRPLVAHVS